MNEFWWKGEWAILLLASDKRHHYQCSKYFVYAMIIMKRSQVEKPNVFQWAWYTDYDKVVWVRFRDFKANIYLSQIQIDTQHDLYECRVVDWSQDIIVKRTKIKDHTFQKEQIQASYHQGVPTWSENETYQIT